MSFKKTQIQTGSKIDCILNVLNSLALVTVNDKTVDIVFPTMEGACVFKDQHEKDLIAYYRNKLVRWKGTEWKNKPSCVVAQADFLQRLIKWPDEKYAQMRRNAVESCTCYGCDYQKLAKPNE